MINITLKDGTIMQVEDGATCLDVAKQISAGLARAALAAEVDGKTVDLKTPLEKDCTMSVLTFDDDMGKWTLRHRFACSGAGSQAPVSGCQAGNWSGY